MAIERKGGKDPMKDIPLRVSKELSLIGTFIGGTGTIIYSVEHHVIATTVSAAIMVGSGVVRSYLNDRQESKE